MTQELEKTVISNPKRELKGEWKLIKVKDLSRVDYIEYMKGVFEEAQEHLHYGRVSVDSQGEISVIGYGIEEYIEADLIKSIEESKS